MENQNFRERVEVILTYYFSSEELFNLLYNDILYLICFHIQPNFDCSPHHVIACTLQYFKNIDYKIDEIIEENMFKFLNFDCIDYSYTQNDFITIDILSWMCRLTSPSVDFNNDIKTTLEKNFIDIDDSDSESDSDIADDLEFDDIFEINEFEECEQCLGA